jgi:tetratricopeptide (TPR) repeat protein
MEPREAIAQALSFADRGRWDDARKWVRSAAELALACADAELFAIATTQEAGWTVHAIPRALTPAFVAAREHVAKSRSPLAHAVFEAELAAALGWRGRFEEASKIVRRMKSFEGELPIERRARARGHASAIMLVAGDVVAADALALGAQILARRVGDDRWQALSRCVQALSSGDRGQERAARTSIEIARALAGEDPLIASIVELCEGELALWAGRSEEAHEAFARSVRAVDHGGPLLGAYAWIGLSAALADRGRIEEATAAEREARRLAERGPEVLRRAIDVRAVHLELARAPMADRTVLERALAIRRDAAARPPLRGVARALDRSIAARCVLFRAPRDLSYFEIAPHPRCTLARAPKLRRLLDRLVALRDRGPLPAHEWIQALGWDTEDEGEYVRAIGRLHQSFYRLRRIAVPELVHCDGEALGLSPRVILDWID